MAHKKKADLRVHFLDMPGGRRARVAPEADEGTGAASKPVSRIRVENQLPFDRMFARKILDKDQHSTANNIHTLWVRAGFVPVKAQAYSEHIGGGKAVEQDFAIMARDKYIAALAGLEPRGRSLTHVTCGEATQSCSQWAYAHDVRREYAVERLRECLSHIAARYGL